MLLRPPLSTLFPYTTLFRSVPQAVAENQPAFRIGVDHLHGLSFRAGQDVAGLDRLAARQGGQARSEEHTSELQSLRHLVCRLLLEKKKKNKNKTCNIPLSEE